MKETTTLKRYRQFVLIPLFVISVVAIVFLFVSIVRLGSGSTLTWIFSFFILVFIFLILLSGWNYFRLLNLQLNLDKGNVDKNEKREHEELQTLLNLYYRLESLKWEKTYQIAKLITEQKKADDKKEETDLINLPVAKSLIAAIKSIKDELDKN